MVIIQVAGGLGNQLQQYALYRKFLSLSKEAKLDISWFDQGQKGENVTGRKLELDYFAGLPYTACTAQEKAAMTGGDGLTGKLRRKLLPHTIRQFIEKNIYHPEIFSQDDKYISGYFACEQYYADILPVLREEIRFPESENIKNREMAEKMKNCQSISVHIRRGDYLKGENAKMFGGICTKQYYDSAMGVMRQKVEKPHFFLFSDDPAYAAQQYQGEEYTIVDINHGADSFYDMWLMSQCRHHICANSTFSFWGARLDGKADKLMIRPTKHKNSQPFVWEEMKELWKGWMFVSPEGTVYEE